jgi:hypothetical protein
MITERLTFQAKYGRGDELVGLMKEMYTSGMADQIGAGGSARVYTDRTGPMFSVVLEVDHADLDAFAAAEKAGEAAYADPKFQAWFGRMVELTEAGGRQLLNMERLG